MLGGIGVQELIIIFLVVLILFGAKRIPEIAQGLGRGIKDFKRAVKDTTADISATDTEKDKSDSDKA